MTIWIERNGRYHYVESAREFGSNDNWRSLCGYIFCKSTNKDRIIKNYRIGEQTCKQCSYELTKKLTKKKSLDVNKVSEDNYFTNIESLNKEVLNIADSSIPSPYKLIKIRKDITKNKKHCNGRDYRNDLSLKGTNYLYFLFYNMNNNMELVYVGKTNNLLSRIQNHRHKDNIQFNLFSYFIIKEEFLAKVLEDIYIYKYKPKYNKVY